MVASLPARCRAAAGHDGHLRAVHDGAGNLLAFTLSIRAGAGRCGRALGTALDSAGHSLWDWDIPVTGWRARGAGRRDRH